MGKIEDPVCGMSVDPLKSPHQHTYNGTRHHFCSAGCKDKFVADLHADLGERAQALPADAGPVYVCPNLPEVEHPSPSDCPVCGSRLELKKPIAALKEDESTAPVDTRRRRWPWSRAT